MGISPLEIRKKEFGKKFRGVDGAEVQSFLEQVAEEMEALLTQKNSISKELDVLKERLSGYMHMEETIQKTLVMAQKTSEEAVENAKKQAELLVQDAKNRGRDIEEQFSQLKSAKKQFVMEFETLLETFHRHIKEFGGIERIGQEAE